MCVVFAACVVLVSLFAGLLAVAAWLWANRRRTAIPGPPTLPLAGNGFSFYKVPVLWDRLWAMHSRYGDIFRFYIGSRLVIVLTQPEDIQSVLLGSKSRENMPREREPLVTYTFRTFLGDGLIGVQGERWKRHRKHIERVFHIEELKKFVDKFNDAGRFLCEQLAESKGSEVEVSHSLVHTTFRSAIATIFDLDLNWIFPDQHRQSEVVDLWIDFGEALSEILYRPMTIFSWTRWMTKEGRILTKFKTVVRYITDRVFALGRKRLDSSKASERSLLAWILKEKNSGTIFTDKELHDEAATMATVGVETITSTMGYALTLLGLHPEWQELAQRELDDCFGTGGDYLRHVTMADIAQLKVIDAILKETGRLFTTVPCMLYVAAKDVPLAGGRYIAARGTTLLIAYYLMHRHPDLFPEPDKFDPGRFLEGGSAESRKAYSYVPFGIGSRKCVGERYAVLQMKVVLATVLRRYHILPGTSREELEDSVVSMVSQPVTGFRVTFIPRDNIPSSSV
ncbi:cytochrome P450 4g1-like [Schistocerca nitens]|uniref:cytochrome P450 4g1-like n=1 Tax=Schistocerca nitens TaxID=7011 RepID=UPI002117FE9D|nr:cytochrome P450 4g1-like [Schistocerca nitens]